MSKRYTNQEIIEMVQKVDNGDYKVIYLDEKATSKTKRLIQYIHLPCQVKSKKFPFYEFVSDGKRRCPICYPPGEEKSKRLSFSYEKVKEIVETAYNKEYTLLSKKYKNSKTKLKILHKTCNKVFEKSLEKFQNEQGCTYCSRASSISAAAIYVHDIFYNFSIDIVREKRYQDCINTKTNKQLSFDYYIPSLNLLIEVDGEQHDRASRGEEEFRKTQLHDTIKNNYAKENGIKLYRLNHREWNQLPFILTPIVEKCLNRHVSKDEMKAIKHSDTLQHIKNLLSKVHNNEYEFLDPFYSGSEREHNYRHKVCGSTFTTTYYAITSRETPCKICRKKEVQESSWQKSKRNFEKRTERYEFDSKYNYRKNGKWWIKCKYCNVSKWRSAANILRGKGGCNCLSVKKAKEEWLQNYEGFKSYLEQESNKKIDKKLRTWYSYHKKKLKENRLKEWQIPYMLKLVELSKKQQTPEKSL